MIWAGHNKGDNRGDKRSATGVDGRGRGGGGKVGKPVPDPGRRQRSWPPLPDAAPHPKQVLPLHHPRSCQNAKERMQRQKNVWQAAYNDNPEVLQSYLTLSSLWTESIPTNQQQRPSINALTFDIMNNMPIFALIDASIRQRTLTQSAVLVHTNSLCI